MMKTKKPRSLSQIGNRAMFPRKTYANNENEIVELRETLIDGGSFLEVPSEKLISVIKSTQEHINSLIKSQMCVEAKKYQVFLNSIQEEINNRVDRIENNPRKLPKTQNRSRDLSSLPKIQEIETDGKRNVEILSNRHEKLLKSFDDIWEYKIKRKYLEPSSKAKRIMAKAHVLKESKKNEEALQALEEYEKVINDERAEALEAYSRDYEEAKMKLMMKQEREKQAVIKEMKRKKNAIITSVEMTRASSSVIGNRTNNIKFARPGAIRKSGNKSNVKMMNTNNPPKPLLPLNNPVESDNDDSSINDHSSQYAYNVIDSHEYDSESYEEDSNHHSGFNSMYVFPNDIENNGDNMNDNHKQLTNDDDSIGDTVWMSNDNHAENNPINDEIRFDSHDKPVPEEDEISHNESQNTIIDGIHNSEINAPEQSIEENSNNIIDDQSLLNHDSAFLGNMLNDQKEPTTISSQNDVMIKILTDNGENGTTTTSFDEKDNISAQNQSSIFDENQEIVQLHNDQNQDPGTGHSLSHKENDSITDNEEQNHKEDELSLNKFEIKPENTEQVNEISGNHYNEITSNTNSIQNSKISDNQQPEQLTDVNPELPKHTIDLCNDQCNEITDNDQNHNEQSLGQINDSREFGDVYALKLDINEYSKNPEEDAFPPSENNMDFDQNNSPTTILSNNLEDLSMYANEVELTNPNNEDKSISSIGDESIANNGVIDGDKPEETFGAYAESNGNQDFNNQVSLANNANNLMNSLLDKDDDEIIPTKNVEFDKNDDIIPTKNDGFDIDDDIIPTKNDEFIDQDVKLDSKQDDFADTQPRNENWSENDDPEFLNSDISENNGNLKENIAPQSTNEPPAKSPNNESLTDNLMNIGKSMFDDDFN